ncbi:MAG: ATP-dependent Clp protease ATP-binding subunit ClpA [Oligoflexales bacterium]|nr:ATP-dependent Clp protease ATP-binding subunit ClpA [Oligoflexales bacterium]
MISHSLEVSLNIAVQVAQKKHHEYVGIEHILFALLDNPEARKSILACGGSVEEIRQDLESFFENKVEALLKQKKGSPQPTLAFQRVLQVAAQHVISAGKDKIFGDNLLIAMYSEKESHAVYFLEKQGISRYDLVNFVSHGSIKEGIDPSVLDSETDHHGREIARLASGSEPEEQAEEEDKTKTKSNSDPEKKKKSLLEQCTVDLCEKAKIGKIDPLIGREHEIERTIQVLCRRRKNNPLLVGDSGVGKTAIAEGLALKITQSEVPEFLKPSKIFSLEMGTLLAGTKFRGDFEQRLKGLIKELQTQEHSILFIDEIHTIMGAGAVSGGSLDASNILKPFLSNGEVRCIGSTTYKEYRQHIENDHAMSRRFQKISVDEPSVASTIKILKGLKPKYEQYHGVRYSNDAIRAAVELSHVHLKDRRLPDKAIDIIDEAGAAWKASGKDLAKPDKNLVGLADIKSVVSKIARIPEQRLSSSDRQNLKDLGESLKKAIFGQDKAVDALERVIRMARSGLGKEDKPIGSFLFSGPTGVGKTELAKQLAKIMGINFVRFDMSEYMERHAVSRLIGAPPGYVGYDEGGLLTDAINKNPYTVLLLDEIEKAHPDVHNILLQVMDHGTLTDSNGRQTDFQNVIIIMTTNVGAAELSKKGIGFSDDQVEEGREHGAIRGAFTPEFRNRLDGIVSFNPLAEKVMLKIVDKFLMEIETKLKSKRVSWEISLAARKYLAKEGYDPAYGARPLTRVIDDKVKQVISEQLLFGKLSKGGHVKVDWDEKGGKLEFKYSK